MTERIRRWSWPRERVVAAGVLGGLFLISVSLWVGLLVTADGEPQAESPMAEPELLEPPREDDASTPERGDQEAGDDAADDEATPEVLELDGRCVVDGSEIDDLDDVHAWDFAECEHAPVDPAGAAGPWIVVVASLDGDEVSETDARARADGSDADRRLLWSSHYPSLTPDLWVVFEGPFPDEDAATAAAEDIGGGSYPRLLADGGRD